MKKGRFGKFGGQFVSEALMGALAELEEAFQRFGNDPAFLSALESYLAEFAGRPTPLTFCRNLSQDLGCRVYLKREDLLHGGAHKLNNTLGQALLAKFMGKKRLIAETGAGQHGVATAIAGAVLGLPVEVYMGEVDIERQHPNVFRMELMGAKVIPGLLRDEDPQGCRERGPPGLGCLRGGDPLPPRLRRGTPPLPPHGPHLPVGDREGDAGPDP